MKNGQGHDIKRKGLIYKNTVKHVSELKKSKTIPVTRAGFDTVDGEHVSFEHAFLLVNDVKIKFKVPGPEDQDGCKGDCVKRLHLIIESEKDVYLIDKIPGIPEKE